MRRSKRLGSRIREDRGSSDDAEANIGFDGAGSLGARDLTQANCGQRPASPGMSFGLWHARRIIGAIHVAFEMRARESCVFVLVTAECDAHPLIFLCQLTAAV